jgi:hypothetical protein
MEHSGALGDLLKVESPCMLLTKLKTVARKQVHWLIPREKKKTLGLLAAEAGDQSSAVASWTWSSSSSGISRSAGRRRRAARSPWPRRRRALLRHHEIAKGFSSRNCRRPRQPGCSSRNCKRKEKKGLCFRTAKSLSRAGWRSSGRTGGRAPAGQKKTSTASWPWSVHPKLSAVVAFLWLATYALRRGG